MRGDGYQITHISLNNIVLKLFGLRYGRHLPIDLLPHGRDGCRCLQSPQKVELTCFIL